MAILILNSTTSPVTTQGQLEFNTDKQTLVVGNSTLELPMASVSGSNHFKQDQFITGSLVVTGNITAKEFHVTYVSSSAIFRSGSTKFGDSSDDTHEFTGSVKIKGTITAPEIASSNSGETDILVRDGNGLIKYRTSVQLGGTQGATGLQGATGPQGTQGVKGDTGDQGFQGHQGFTGVQGSTGAQGDQGHQGNQGVQGSTGVQGSVGAQGDQGHQGNQGVQGSVGVQGSTGFQGVQGHQGEQGFQGHQGRQGNQGFQGTQGNQGVSDRFTSFDNSTNETISVGSKTFTIATGLSWTSGQQTIIGVTGDGSKYLTATVTSYNSGTGQFVVNVTSVVGSGTGITTWSINTAGATGQQGAQGTQGTAGIQGIDGTQGAQGNIGAQGDTGAQGVQGVQGIQGVQGSTGEQGHQGFQGNQGVQGTNGAQGSEGVQGHQGNQGFQGVDGTNGINGDQGATGAQGTTGIQGSKGDTGEQGAQGITGTQGATGTQGLKGDKGDQGDQGAKGDQGDQGAKGDQGNQGFQGIAGTVADLPTGTVSGSSQILGATGIVSSSQQISNYNKFLEFDGDNVVSSSSQIISLLPTGVVSGSIQILGGSDIASGSFETTGRGIISGSSQLNNTTVTNLTITNLTTVNQTSSVLFSSGSNKFGDFGTDVHEFTGSVQISGSLSVIAPIGTTETNILVADGSGNIRTRSNLSLTGAQGFQGTQGNQGAQGNQGVQGVQGAQGFQGLKGDVGNQGFQGIKGDKGDIGNQGFQGLKGDKGDQGNQGFQGLKGDKGDKGDQGNQGLKGDKGDKGDQGNQGIKGDKGDKGDQGFKGDKGDKGDQGNTGAAGGFTTDSNAQVNSLGVGTGASGTAGEIRATNNITAYYSDRRLKKDIEKISNALSKLEKINGVFYTQNELAETFGYNDYSQQVGVIAQEIQEVLPEAVAFAPFDRDENDNSKSGENYLTVRYEKIVPLLIEAIKELLNRVEKLEK